MPTWAKAHHHDCHRGWDDPALQRASDPEGDLRGHVKGRHPMYCIYIIEKGRERVCEEDQNREEMRIFSRSFPAC